ncbi:MAG: glycosyltransferase [Anaerolineales bacterium]|nr:glycosyltransferase [Anaerolineales bacterium]
MKVLYHLPVLPPKLPGAEALSQEIHVLQKAFAGQINFINPNQQSPVYIPRLLFGMHQLRRLWQMEAAFDLHHSYNPDPFPYPILRLLHKPVVYSISSGLGEKRPFLPYFRRLAAVTVYDERSLKKLQDWGLTNAYRVQSGIDTACFTHTPQPLDGAIRLLVASAPWTPAQFKTKGIDALLAAAQQMPSLRLLFLWRGVLADVMTHRVQQAGLADRAQVINELVDVNEMLATVHGTVNLAMDTAVIKAYPHSLLDSLAAGKPVITSRAITMSDYVDKTGCGVVVESVSATALVAAIKQFEENYAELVKTAAAVGQRDFTLQKMIDSWRIVYQSVQK